MAFLWMLASVLGVVPPRVSGTLFLAFQGQEGIWTPLVRRTYLTVQNAGAEAWGYRLTLDSRPYEGRLEVFVKYAYLEGRWGPLRGRWGRVPTPWVGSEERIWGLRAVAPVFLDRLGWQTSATEGMAVLWTPGRAWQVDLGVLGPWHTGKIPMAREALRVSWQAGPFGVHGFLEHSGPWDPWVLQQAGALSWQGPGGHLMVQGVRRVSGAGVEKGGSVHGQYRLGQWHGGLLGLFGRWDVLWGPEMKDWTWMAGGTWEPGAGVLHRVAAYVIQGRTEPTRAGLVLVVSF